MVHPEEILPCLQHPQVIHQILDFKIQMLQHHNNLIRQIRILEGFNNKVPQQVIMHMEHHLHLVVLLVDLVK